MTAMVVLPMLVLLQLAVPGLAQSPPSGTVTIESFTYAGPACPPGSSEGRVSSDGLTLILILPDFSVFTPGSPADRRKSCRFAVGLIYPAGFTFTLASVTFRGYAQFDEGVTGSLAASYHLSHIPGTDRVVRKLPPPVEDNFEFTASFLTSVASPCDRTSVTLNIEYGAEVNPVPLPGNNNSGLITIDSQDQQFGLVFLLNWKKC